MKHNPSLISRSPKIKKILLAVLSGAAAFAAFPPLGFSIAAWIAFVPLFFVVKNTGYKGAFWYSLLCGVVFWGSVLYWLTNVSVPGFFMVVLLMAGFYALFGLMVKLAMKYSMNLFAVSFAWVVLEYCRAHFLTGFPWAILGYSQYTNINIIQVADISGAYGVSFLIVVFNVAVYAWVSGNKRKVSYMMVALLFIVCSTSYGIYRIGNPITGETAKISVIQGNISQALKWDAFAAGDIVDKYSGLTLKAAMDEPDIIIWPETSYPYLMEYGDSFTTEMEELAVKTGIPIVAGAVYKEGEAYYNSAILFEPAGGSEMYRKIHLVPFGEYVPFEEHLVSLRKYIDKPIGSFVSGKEYKIFPVRSARESVGPDSSLIRRTVFHKMGVMICFEDVFPYIARNFVSEGARILVNITNDAWFGDTAASRQHLQASVFRAVENRVPVARAANTGISCFIDINGKINSQVISGGREIFVDGWDTSEVKTTPLKSYYTVYGDMFVYFSGVFLILVIISGYFSSVKKHA